MLLSEERAIFDRRELRIFFRSSMPCVTANLIDSSGQIAATAPTLLLGDEYSCSLDISQLRPGDFSVVLKGKGGNARFGRLVAENRAQLTRAASGLEERTRFCKLTSTTIPVDNSEMHAWLYADVSTFDLRLWIGQTGDIDKFLAARASDPAAKPKPIRFSVVSPVYNVERYLEEFLASITSQTLDFKSHIELIMVDDGSTDRSTKIIKRWRRKYPNNIRYFHKENGGISSARNFGLSHASHEWITFSDPDDFVDRRYFAEVAQAIRRFGEERIAMVSCSIINYYETTQTRLDNHYLRFKFANGTQVLPTEDLGRFVQFNINSSFVSKRILADSGLRFDGRIRPNFEDTRLIQSYLLQAPGKSVVFLPDAHYFYRHRADQSSLVQTAPQHLEWYGDQLELGYLALLDECVERVGGVPCHVENIVVCDLYRQLREVVDRAEAVDFLGDDRCQRLGRLLRAIYSRIDARAIYDYDVSRIPLMYRAGILNLFKKVLPPYQWVECRAVDGPGQQILIGHYTGGKESLARFLIDGRDIVPDHSKAIRHDFLGEDFIWEHIAWITTGEARTLRVEVDGSLAVIEFGGRRYEDGLPLAAGLDNGTRSTGGNLPGPARKLRDMARRPDVVAAFRHAWVFMDRNDQADDNAEHLYRYVRRHHPEINAHFVLDPGTPDWRRLDDDGFRLLAFNSPEHACALFNASVLISSQADHYVTEFLDRRRFPDLDYRFVFLQHGVTKDDISSWLNDKPIDLMITCTDSEYRSIVGDGSRYRFTAKEVVLTGFPRHDMLRAAASDPSKAAGQPILVMPTWRASLTGPATGPGRTRSVVAGFDTSTFAATWRSLLHSPRLAELAKDAGGRVVFIVHPHLEQYLGFFDPPPWVEVFCLGSGGSIQKVFAEGTALVTDYSSVAFEMAYLFKPVIYYHFDRKFIAGGGHLYRPGYFDYERDGFGPIFTEEEDLLSAVEDIVLGKPPDPVYRRRAERAFPFRDGKCCKRVFNAILELERPYARSTDRTERMHALSAHGSNGP